MSSIDVRLDGSGGCGYVPPASPDARDREDRPAAGRPAFPPLAEGSSL